MSQLNQLMYNKFLISYFGGFVKVVILSLLYSFLSYSMSYKNLIEKLNGFEKVEDKIFYLERNIEKVKDKENHIDLLYTLASLKTKKPFFPKIQNSRVPLGYKWSPLDDAYIYTGKEIDELLKKYPKSNYLDDAAYLRLSLPQIGECEGSITCNIERETNRELFFLKKYKSSPYNIKVFQKIQKSIFDIFQGHNLRKGEKLKDNQVTAFVQFISEYEDAINNISKNELAVAYYTIASIHIYTGNKVGLKKYKKKLLSGKFKTYPKQGFNSSDLDRIISNIKKAR